VETFQRSFPQDSGKFCTLFNNLGGNDQGCFFVQMANEVEE